MDGAAFGIVMVILVSSSSSDFGDKWRKMLSKIGSIISLEGPTASTLCNYVQSRAWDCESIFAIYEMETLNVGRTEIITFNFWSSDIWKLWKQEEMEQYCRKGC